MKSKFDQSLQQSIKKFVFVPTNLQHRVTVELDRLQKERHIENYLVALTNFFSPMVITVKIDQAINLALDSKVLKKSIHKNKYQMPDIEMLIDSISQHLTNTQKGQQAYFFTLDLKYSYSQLQLHKSTAKH